MIGMRPAPLRAQKGDASLGAPDLAAIGQPCLILTDRRAVEEMHECPVGPTRWPGDR
jgi:hypothetical protein